MKNLKSILLTAMVVLMNLTTWAHALRIETPENGKVGQAQDIHVYYGEYNEKEDEELDKWYSDVSKFKLYVISPSGKKSELTTTAKSHFYNASFTPKENGVYTVFIGHSAKELGGDYVYQFNSSAIITVGKSNTKTSIVKEGNDLQVVLNSSKKTISGVVYFKGKPLTNASIEVVSPNNWMKKFKTNATGGFEIPSQGSGKYFLEASHTEDVKGEHYSNAYEHIWRCATVVYTLN